MKTIVLLYTLFFYLFTFCFESSLLHSLAIPSGNCSSLKEAHRMRSNSRKENFLRKSDSVKEDAGQEGFLSHVDMLKAKQDVVESDVSAHVIQECFGIIWSHYVLWFFFCIALFTVTFYLTHFHPLCYISIALACFPVLVWVCIKWERLWGSSLGQLMNWVRSSEKICVLFIVCFVLFELLIHLGIPLGSFSYVVSGLGWFSFIVFTLPIIGDFLICLIHFINRLLHGKNPFVAINEDFTKGLALFLLFLVPLVSNYFPLDLCAIALISVVITLAELLEDRIVELRNESIDHLKETSSAEVLAAVFPAGSSIDLDSSQYFLLSLTDIESELERGNTVIAYCCSDAPIPHIDGVVVEIEGSPRIDKSSFTGETRCHLIKKNDFIEGSSSLIEGSVYMRVELAGSKTAIGQLTEALKKFNPNGFSEVKSLSSKVIKYFGVFLILCSLMGFFITGLWVTVIASLASICICPFLVGIPLSFVSVRQNMAESHIIATSNEAFSPINILIFDKTNTLTSPHKNKISIEDMWFNPNEKVDWSRLLFSLAVLEYKLKEHNSYAKLIVELAINQEHNIDHISEKANDVDIHFHEGGGLEGEYDGQKLFVGSFREWERIFLLDHGDSSHLEEMRAQRDQLIENNMSPVLVYDYASKKVLCMLPFRSELRPGVNDFLHELKDLTKRRFYHKIFNYLSSKLFRFTPYHSQGICVMVASGDSKEHVEKILKTVSIPFALAETKPKDKAKFVYWLEDKNNLASLKRDFYSDDKKVVLTWKEFEQTYLSAQFSKEFDDLYHSFEGECSTDDTDVNSTKDPRTSLLNKERRKDNRIGMIGDGTNDVLALKMAHVGFSFESATQFSQASADVLLGDDEHLFDQLLTFLKAQRRLYVCIFINIFVIAFLWNALIITLILTQQVFPSLVGFLHAMNTLLVIAISLSLIKNPYSFFKRMLFGVSKKRKDLSETNVVLKNERQWRLLKQSITELQRVEVDLKLEEYQKYEDFFDWCEHGKELPLVPIKKERLNLPVSEDISEEFLADLISLYQKTKFNSFDNTQLCAEDSLEFHCLLNLLRSA